MKVKKEMEVLSRAIERAVLTPQEKVAVGRSLQRLAAIMAGYSDAGDKGVIGGYNGTFPLTAATAGNIYLEPKTGKYYRCETNYNGTQITGPNSNFVDLSVVANADRLNNLIKTVSLEIPVGKGIIDFTDKIPIGYKSLSSLYSRLGGATIVNKYIFGTTEIQYDVSGSLGLICKIFFIKY